MPKRTSPARSEGGVTTPRCKKTRGSRSLCSPALSTASGRLTSLIDQFKDKNMDSFALSPLNGRSVLNDNTEIEELKRKSWWRKLDENSQDMMEVLEDNRLTTCNAIDEMFDIEVLSQEKKNYTLDLPESSDNESIKSIVLPQRRLFTQKENQPQKKYGQLIDNRESLAKLHKTNTTGIDKTVNVGRDLFSKAKRSKIIFPAALLNISPNETAADKTRENVLADPKPQVRNLFGNRPVHKRKNMFSDFIVCESDEEIPEIQPRVFGFQKKLEQRRISSISKGRDASPASSVTTDIEMDFRMLLPSSTMVENQLEENMLAENTPIKQTRLSKLSEAKESEAGTLQTNTISDKTKQSNTSVASKNKSKASPEIKNKSLNSSIITRSMFKNASKSKENVNTSVEQDTRGSNSRSKISSKGNELSLPNTTATNKIVDEKERTDIIKVHDNVDNTGSNDVKQNEEEDDENNFTLEYENDEVLEEAEIHKDLNENQKDNTTKHNTVVLEKDSQETEINNSKSNKSKLTNKSFQQKPAKIVEGSVEFQTDQYSANYNADGNQEQETANVQKKDEAENEVSECEDKEEVNESDENEDEANVSDVNENEANESQEVEAEVNESQEIEEEGNESQEVEAEVNESQEIEEEAKESQEAEVNETQEIEEEANESHKVEAVLSESQEIEEEANESQEVEAEVNESQGIEEEANESQEVEPEANESQEIGEEANESQEAEVNESQEIEEEANESHEVEAEVNETQEIEEEANKSHEVEAVLNESQEIEEEANESQEVEAEVNESQEIEEEANESQEVAPHASDDENDEGMDEDEEEKVYDSRVNDASANESQEVENDEEENHEVASEAESEELEEDQRIDDSDEADEAIASDPEISGDNQADEMEVDDDEGEQESDNESEQESDNESEQESDNENEQNEHESHEESQIEEQNEIEPSEEIAETPNVTHDTTGRHRKKDLNKSPEVLLNLRGNTNQMDSFTAKASNNDVRKTKSMIKNPNLRPSLVVPPRDSIGFSDGTKDSSAEGSGWDSHRTTRKTLRQTFGKDFTPRKSLRALVMEQSAKRQAEHMEMHSETVQFPLANSTEMPEDSNQHVEDIVESNHEVSRRTRRAELEVYLQKMKERNIEKRLKLEAEVRNSFKNQVTNPLDLFKVPTKPAPRRPKPAQSKPKKKLQSIIPFDDLPAEVIQDMKYKPPKRYQPRNAIWVTKRLYKFLENKLEAKYDYKARMRAEKLVERINHFVKELRRQHVASPDAVEVLKHEFARLDIVRTHFEFYEFFQNFMPREVRIKVIPDIVNKIALPRDGVFSDISL